MHVYNKMHVFIITLLLHVYALIVPSSGRSFLYARTIVTVYDYNEVLPEDGAISA
jgi:hypothetical protein